jgi:hypothetical protein
MGSTDPAIIEGQDQLEEAGLAVDYLRIRALPVCSVVREFWKTTTEFTFLN